MAAPRKPRARKPAAPTTPDPIEIAMEAEAKNTAPDSPARRLLVQQEKLVGWQIAGERMSFALKALTAAAGLALVIALAVEVWSASRANGLVIEAFSVPPALAERGVTGEAVARRLMARFEDMATVASSAEQRRGMAASWQDNITVEIANTGLSLNQIDQWLRRRLGHEVRITGEVEIGRDGALTIQAHRGSSGVEPVTGSETELPAMLQTVAEAIYAKEQPRTLASYYMKTGRFLEAQAQYAILADDLDPGIRAMGLTGLGNIEARLGRPGSQQRRYFRMSADIGTDGAAFQNLRRDPAGLREASLTLLIKADAAYARSPQVSAVARRQRRLSGTGDMSDMRGDHQAAFAAYDALSRQRIIGTNNPGNNNAVLAAQSMARMHDISGALRRLEAIRPLEPNAGDRNPQNLLRVVWEAEDWPRFVEVRERLRVTLATNPAALPAGPPANLDAPVPTANLALALAHVGRIDEAKALIAGTPRTCEPCVRIRGQIAALTGEARTADHWLGWAVKMAPSLPQASYDWGRVLLERREYDKAIEQFENAHAKSPRYADPLSGWGEALLKQGKARAAIAKFRQANRYAPNWGRNHLLWGEALAARGKAAEARAQWRVAERLDLTPDERARLARNLAGGTR